MSNSEEFEFNKVCRTCLSTTDLKSLYANNSTEDDLAAILMTCTSMKYYENDGLPIQICTKCITELHRSYKFAVKCRETDKKLRHYVQKLVPQIYAIPNCSRVNYERSTLKDPLAMAEIQKELNQEMDVIKNEIAIKNEPNYSREKMASVKQLDIKLEVDSDIELAEDDHLDGSDIPMLQHHKIDQETSSDEDELHSTSDFNNKDSSSEPETEYQPNIPKKPKLDAANPKLKWTNSEFSPIIHKFDASHSGCKHPYLSVNASILDCFEVFFTREIMEIIAEESNKYYHFVSNQCQNEFSRLKRWKRIDYKELYCFFAVTLLMPQVKKLKIKDYWSNDPMLVTPAFSQIMKRDRYMLILRVLHFAQFEENEDTSVDSLRKIRRIIEYLRIAFRSTFAPYQNICVNESLFQFNNRYIKKYIPKGFGVKFYLICDCSTGYVLDFIIHTEQISDTVKNLEKPDQIVLTLMKSYMGKGHNLYVHNASPALFTQLHANATNVCGTVKSKRKNMPCLNEKLNNGQIIAKSTNTMLYLKYHDRKDVRILTTCHRNDLVPCGRVNKQTGCDKLKPISLIDYNLNMRVTKSDLLISVDSVTKWYKKVFLHLLDLTISNACVLHEQLTGKTMTKASLQVDLVKQIVERYHEPISRSGGGRRSGQDDCPLRLTERHFPHQIPSTGKKKNASKRCVVCIKTNKRCESRYMCTECNVALCIVPCFERYHIVKHYEILTD